MLPIHTILFPTDFSDNAQQVFPLACSLARDCGARIVVVYVLPAPLGHDKIEAERDPDEYYADVWKMLDQMQAPDENVRVERRLEEGSAAKRIVEIAREVQAGLIIMGTHGKTGLERLLMGSVAEEVVRKAECPVLTVKRPFPNEKATPVNPQSAT